MDRNAATVVGLIFGLALGFAGAFGGWSAFAIVLVLGVVGLTAGRVVDGHLDLADYLGERWQNRTRR
jgi:hypothetical protein